jgi:peptidoglycan/LPS O-acetylase OafA/YrhL
VFWILDGYYLALERKFRGLFETASQLQDDTPNFSFAAGISAADWKAACRRPAVFLVHFPVIVLSIGIGVVAFLIKHFGWH